MPSPEVADPVAVLAGDTRWHPCSLLCFMEQFEAVSAGAVVYDAGLCSEARMMLRKRQAVVT